ncbi:hypothetical protein PRZ48_005750 [Zasmidium cellare]|uniref:Uncharacterized protein n=1 Tax=Zasmidium cellare TaxID=395010 RepID=A0ABR0ELE9_ZASCE|nr:hypothetical protein PRZ48_005750 [Zasmidium cellare]
MHIPTWLLIAKKRLSCKNINKLRKPRSGPEPEDNEKIPVVIDEKSNWIHDPHALSTIFEEKEHAETSTMTSSSEKTPWSLLDDPEVFRLCDGSTLFEDADRLYDYRDPRASSKVFVDNNSTSNQARQRRWSVHSGYGFICGTPRLSNLQRYPSPPHIDRRDTPILGIAERDSTQTLTQTQSDLAYTTAALSHANNELEYFRLENSARYDRIQELAAQVYALERVRGFGRRKLRREVRELTGCLFEMDLRLALQVKRIRELEESVEAWKGYAVDLEEELEEME